MPEHTAARSVEVVPSVVVVVFIVVVVFLGGAGVPHVKAQLDGSVFHATTGGAIWQATQAEEERKTQKQNYNTVRHTLKHKNTQHNARKATKHTVMNLEGG